MTVIVLQLLTNPTEQMGQVSLGQFLRFEVRERCLELSQKSDCAYGEGDQQRQKQKWRADELVFASSGFVQWCSIWHGAAK